MDDTQDDTPDTLEVITITDAAPPVAGDLAPLPDARPWDAIGVLRVGDVDGLAGFVGRAIGFGDRSVYDEHMHAYVEGLSDEAGVDCHESELSGVAWAAVLPSVKLGDGPSEVTTVLRNLLGLAAGGNFDAEVAEIISSKTVDVDEWIDAIRLAEDRNTAETA